MRAKIQQSFEGHSRNPEDRVIFSQSGGLDKIAQMEFEVRG
jgi:hypothetical protein